MPPKPKYQREQIVDAAFALAREAGLESVKAREVGERLGCSSRPIFTFFNSMEELHTAVRERAWALFERYLDEADDYHPAFKKRGMQMVRFAQEEPRLFQLLFMTQQEPVDFETLMGTRLKVFDRDLQTIQELYHITRQEAQVLTERLWVQAYGMCVLCATRICTFSQSRVAEMLGQVFGGGIQLLRSGNQTAAKQLPMRRGTELGELLKQAFPEITKP